MADQQQPPIVRKKKQKPYKNPVTQSTVATYQPASVIPGIRHIIEGRENVSQLKQSGSAGNPVGFIGAHDMTTMSYAEQQAIKERQRANPTFNKNQEDTYKATLARYALEDAARGRIRPIADPEATKDAERKKAARKRMRGRLGTMLSTPDRLG